MSQTPPPAETPAPDPSQARRERHALIVARMLAVGMKRLDANERQLEEAATAAEREAADRAYDRITRSLRLTMAYEKRLEDEGLARAREAAAQAEAAAAARAQRGRARKLLVRQTMRSMLTDLDLAEADYERLSDASDDWMEAAPDDAFADPPTGRMLARLCADLGVPLNLFDLMRFAWARDEVFNRPPGSPFTDLRCRDAHDAAAPVFWRPAEDPEEEPTPEPLLQPS